MFEEIDAIVVRGQGLATGIFTSGRAHFEAALGMPTEARSLNLCVDRVFATWPWKVSPDLFGPNARRQECTVNRVRGFVVAVESPAPIYRDEANGRKRYTDPEKTMFEVVCTASVEGVRCDTTVRLATDLDALESSE
jgi:hypothetical protein